MQNHGRSHRVAGAFIALLSISTVFGQTGSGTIQGTVKDGTGAVIPVAAVTATNVATGVQTARVTTGSGLYVLSPLPPGSYNLQVTAPGFQVLSQENITVDALATIGLDFTLKVGNASEQVTVEATAPALRTEDATLGHTMQNKVYNTLPLAMSSGVPRDPTQFIALAPGVAAVVTQAAGPSYTSFNGAQQETNGLYLEGVAMTFPNQQGDTRPLALGVSVEAVEQFQVEVNGQKAQWQGQGFHNYQLKSGTNQFHGAVYEYFRNTALDARGFFAGFVPVDHQNEFGGNLGGPVIKNKMFFFSNYSGYYFNTSSAPNLITIPSLAFRKGDYSALPAGATIYDPASMTCAGAICSKTPFAGNIIPANRLSKIAQSFQSYLPNPTNSGITNNFLGALPRQIHNWNTTNKVDWNQSANNRFYGVFVRGKWSTDYTGNLTPTGTALPLPYTTSPGIVEELPTIAQIHFTRVVTPTLINNFSVAATRLWIPIYSTTVEGKYVQAAGLKGLPPRGDAPSAFPGINFAGNNAPSNWGGAPFNEAQNNYVLQDSLQWVHGKHAVSFGFQLQFMQNNDARPNSGTGAIFNFSNVPTAGFAANGNLINTTGHAYASYLLGDVTSATITDNTLVWAGHRFRDYSWFVQDDWKVTSKLTLNLGLRYDIFRPYQEQYSRLSFLSPDLPNPEIGGFRGALQYGGTGANTCNCSAPIQTHYRNFQPRIGLAYSLNNKTVVRAGFLMAYTHGSAGVGGNGATGPGRTGYNAPAAYASVVTGQAAFNWEAGVPTAPTPPLLTPGFGTGFTTANPAGAVGMTYLDPALSGRPPYYIDWNIGLQRELRGNLTLGATYSASVGHFLPRNGDNGIWTNSMHPRYLVLGSLLAAQATPANLAAAQRIIPGVAPPFSNYQGTIGQMLSPFPQFNAITYYVGLGNSSYHSFQATLNRRFSRGFTAQFGYTFSKEIDNLPSGGQLGAVGGTRDPYNGGLDKGLGVIDRPHLFRGTFVYELPFGKGRAISGGKAVNALIGNWSISGILTYSSSAPLSITGSGCLVTGVRGACLASYNRAFNGNVRINGDYGDGNALGTGAVSYLDRAAFSAPAPYTFGDLPRSAPYNLFGMSLWNQDVSLRRIIGVTERWKVLISADVFNVPNNVRFAPPGTNIDAANFGQVTTQANGPRKIQFNARITF
jgi:hypothetical protein